MLLSLSLYFAKLSLYYAKLNNYFDSLPKIDWRQWFGTPRAQGEVAHLAFHTAKVTSVAAGHDALLQDFIQDVVMKGFPVLRGE
jgi:hypothetical protein